jgi:hypothetical protein
MKTHVITTSRYFLKSHPRAGQETYFVDKVLEGSKIHTLRGNYEYWEKRINEVNAHKALLSIRFWSASPYNYLFDDSKQVEYAQRFAGQCGIQKAEFNGLNITIDGKAMPAIFIDYLAKNDGLYAEDFIDWFKKSPKEPMAIIHFTNFKY